MGRVRVRHCLRYAGTGGGAEKPPHWNDANCGFADHTIVKRTQPTPSGPLKATFVKARRQELYKQFIDEASKLYADALAHGEAEVSAPVSVYALVSRMRVLSSSVDVEKAEKVLQMVVDRHFEPNKTFSKLRALLRSHPIDPLQAFSKKCGTELQTLKDPWARDGANDGHAGPRTVDKSHHESNV